MVRTQWSSNLTKESSAVALEGHSRERFGQNVGAIVLALNPLDLEDVRGDEFSDVERTTGDVLGLRVENRIVCKRHST